MGSPRRIKVAFCLDSFAIGGTELNAVRTAEALDLSRIELHVFHLQTIGPLRSRYERLGVPMTHVPIRNLYSPRTALQGLRLAGKLRREAMDVVHSHDLYCNLFVVPWARLFTGSAVIASRRWGRKASRPELAAANRWASRFAHRVLANSEAVGELIMAEEGVPREKVVVLPNFLSETAFEAADETARLSQRREWGLPEDTFAVGILARLTAVKNHDLLFHAMASLDSHFHLVLIGDGPKRAHLEALAATLGIASRIHFAGEVVSPRNLHQFVDASVLCSLSEGFPNSLIEAMAAGRPVVATPVGGVTDAVQDGATGILVPLGDPAPLAAALRRLEADAALRARLGVAARAAARSRYRQQEVIGTLSALYETLSSRAPARDLSRADV